MVALGLIQGDSNSPEFTVMGVVNVTPDSFSDGGEWFDGSAAISHGLELAAAGAKILDVGGESTRPGADPVSEAEELKRVIPVIEGILQKLPVGHQVVVSIDTTKSKVAEAAINAGASYVNDVSALQADSKMAGVVAKHGVRCCLMHMVGTPRTMQASPSYDDVVSEVIEHLKRRVAVAIAAGISPEKIDLDPGIGFGKSVEHNLQLLAGLPRIVDLGHRVVVGTSRKSFLGAITGRNDPRQRLSGTIATNVLALRDGAEVFRVHDVGAVHDALTVASAVIASK